MLCWLVDSPPTIQYISPPLETDIHYSYHVGVDIDSNLWYCWKDTVKGELVRGNWIPILDKLPSGGILIISKLNSSSQRVQIFEKLQQSGQIFSHTLDRTTYSLLTPDQPFILKGHPQYDLLACLFNDGV